MIPVLFGQRVLNDECFDHGFQPGQRLALSLQAFYIPPELGGLSDG